LEKKEQRSQIEIAMQQLFPDDAMILTLFYLMEMHLDEICETMELSNTNAKTKLSRARQRLKIIIERDFKELVI
jgi:RNA polymerase sigma-70 factor (ECF subfamily)